MQTPVGARFGEGIGLAGYDLQSSASALQLLLHWQALASMDTRYKLFVHLTGEGDPSDIYAQADQYPGLPTTTWIPGEYLSDKVALSLPDALLSGRYQLLVGWYDEITGQRLPAHNAFGEQVGDSFLLQHFAPRK
jgi:hypothetical protein